MSTCWDTGSLVLARWFAPVGVNAAVRVCDPADKLLVAKMACPLTTSAEPSDVVPS